GLERLADLGEGRLNLLRRSLDLEFPNLDAGQSGAELRTPGGVRAELQGRFEVGGRFVDPPGAAADIAQSAGEALIRRQPGSASDAAGGVEEVVGLVGGEVLERTKPGGEVGFVGRDRAAQRVTLGIVPGEAVDPRLRDSGLGQRLSGALV